MGDNQANVLASGGQASTLSPLVDKFIINDTNEQVNAFNN